MYEELVKRLRHCSEEHSGCGMCELSDTCVLRTRLLLQAADAIEELSHEYESVAKSLNESVELVRKLQSPAADVAPVVRCGECLYAYDSVGGWCCSHGVCVDCTVPEDFFCADGKRKGGEA